MADKKYLDYEGLQEVVSKVKEYVGERGHLEFKGTVANVAALPALSDQKVGWMYTVLAAGITTADFTDGAGKAIAANSEVSAVKVEGTTQNPVWSKDGGTTYVDADLDAVTLEGTVGAGTKLCEVYVADGTETHLVSGTWYATEDGSSFFTVTALAETFADFTKEAVSDEDAIAELGTKYTGSAFADLNVYTETITADVMKWCLLGPVFDVSDKLTFGDTMPSNPEDGDVFLYMGATTYVYTEVTVNPGDDPAALGWYHSDDDGATWSLATEHTADTATYKYATKDEQYVTGVIYKYDLSQTKWVAQSSGDSLVPITNGEIDVLFE